MRGRGGGTRLLGPLLSGRKCPVHSSDVAVTGNTMVVYCLGLKTVGKKTPVQVSSQVFCCPVTV